ncbi:MAG TPA: helicase-related protein, partial [Thermoanaerobaculia bacterium]|nr:helicase-related protein [Thermoanaerobaculia bacterium]
AEKAYELRVRFPGPGDPSAPPALDPERDPETSVWDLVVPEIEKTIRRNRSTLVFANSRRTTEKLTRMINAGKEGDLAYSHHGSLSREVRQVVEERLKRGELPAIVATSSLELGIDIGALDEVVLVQTPPAVSSAVQRIGRAGHRVGEVSRGSLVPLFGRDFLDAAVVARAVLDRDIEEVRPPEAPLDVLAQVILSMTAGEAWELDALFGTLRAMWPYRNLSRRHFDLVLEMLAGRYADSRVRELRPRVTVDRVEGTVRARPGAERLVYLSGGTIPDRGYYHLRLEGPDGPRLGELDEEFVWERSVGDTFTLGTQIWRVRRITHNDVIVEPARGSAAMAPFWRADARDRGFFLSEKVSRFLEAMEGRIDGEDGPLLDSLGAEHAMDVGAAAELVRLLRSQKAALGGRLPHRHRLMVEHVASDEVENAPRPDSPDRARMVLHTFWGGEVNRLLAMALSAAWEERFGARPEVLHDDDCLMVTVPRDLAGEDPLAVLLERAMGDGVEELLRGRLEATGFFGALFRQNAARALLLPRAGFRHRTPLWVTRQRSKRLLEAVGRYGDFPVVLETWRTCLEDELDLETLKRLLEEVRAGAVAVRHARTEAPSPFASNLLWKQTNVLMYADDSPDAEGARGPALRRDLLRELVFSSRLRPRVPPAVVAELRGKLQRTAPGYAPRDADELLDWLRERLLLPAGEWRELLAAVERDLRERRAAKGEPGEAAPAARNLAEEIAGRAVHVHLPGAPTEVGAPAVAALEALPRLAEALGVEGGARGLALASLLDPDREPPPEARENLERLLAAPPVPEVETEEGP